MRVLKSVQASKEQLPLVLNSRPGVAVIRGAAGSGKTTTALLRLRQLVQIRRTRRERIGDAHPVRVLVLTFNRSLAGYVSALAHEQVQAGADLDLRVATFASWAYEVTQLMVMPQDDHDFLIAQFGAKLGLETPFLLDETDYALGRFPSGSLHEYLQRDRDGRGLKPRVDKRRLHDEVLVRYTEYKRTQNLLDWNDQAEAAGAVASENYDIVVVDEAQDFSANQLRSIISHAAPDASITFILDTVQRIYPRFYTWKEIGLDASNFVLSARLKQNQRNTRQIAAFARPFVEGLPIDENGELPDFDSAISSGELPQVFEGSFKEQADAIVKYLSGVDLSEESVGILHPLGGGWFQYLEARLDEAGVEYVTLSRNSSWPEGPTNVGLSTLHSAKGLEFDHVIICGVTGQTAAASADDEANDWQNLRRLLAMGFGRARKGLLLCHDPAHFAPILALLDPGTYEGYQP